MEGFKKKLVNYSLKKVLLKIERNESLKSPAYLDKFIEVSKNESFWNERKYKCTGIN